MQKLKQLLIGEYFWILMVLMPYFMFPIYLWRVKKPSDLVTIGQSLKVKITKIDKTTNRVSASNQSIN